MAKCFAYLDSMVATDLIFIPEIGNDSHYFVIMCPFTQPSTDNLYLCFPCHGHGECDNHFFSPIVGIFFRLFVIVLLVHYMSFGLNVINDPKCQWTRNPDPIKKTNDYFSTSLFFRLISRSLHCIAACQSNYS